MAIVSAAELFTTRLALVKPERDIADDGLDVAALAIEVRPLEAYCRVAEYTRADCLSVALAAIEVRVLPDVRVLPAGDTVERATFLATPGSCSCASHMPLRPLRLQDACLTWSLHY